MYRHNENRGLNGLKATRNLETMTDHGYILTNANVATMDPDISGPYGALQHTDIAVVNGLISWISTPADTPAKYKNLPRHDMDGRLITPALIDCHTHIVAGGNRAKEFEMRLQRSEERRVGKEC